MKYEIKKNIIDFLLFSDKQQCKLCLMTFHSRGQFLDHFITKHSKSHKNPHPHSHSFYYCTLCDMGNTYQKTCSLLRHIQMIHIEKCFMTIDQFNHWYSINKVSADNIINKLLEYKLQENERNSSLDELVKLLQTGEYSISPPMTHQMHNIFDNISNIAPIDKNKKIPKLKHQCSM